MKKIIISLLLFTFCKVNAQQNFCGKPDPNFCPGNIFTNGNFETLVGDPDARTDEDINVARGWSPIWQSGSLADLFCENTLPHQDFLLPSPKSGVYASMWISNRNTNSALYREGMFNNLQSVINPNTGSYTFNFTTARLSKGQASAVEIGIYGVSFTGGALPAAPTTELSPTNINLFGAGKTVLLGIISVPASANNSWVNQSITFNTSISGFPTAGINHILITKSDNVLPGLAQMYMAFDNFCLQVSTGTPESFCGCVNSDNLIKNGNFNNGDQGFSSKFTPMGNSFVPGTYTVVDGDGARTLCSNWLSGSGCGKDGQIISKFLAVNGKTGQQGHLTAWGQSVNVETGKEYKFCFKLGNLRQCCFNVDPKVTILYNDGVQQKTIGPITVSANNSPCNWLNYSIVIVIPPGATPTINLPINIALDQSGLGDGNDLAIDDISLIQLKQMDRSNTCWTSTEFPPDNAGLYRINASMTALPANAAFYWEVSLIEKNGVPVNPIVTVINPAVWWANPLLCDFKGYDGNTGQMTNISSPGTFNINNRYRITRGTWGECNAWGACSKTTTTDATARKVKLTDDNYIPKRLEKN